VDRKTNHLLTGCVYARELWCILLLQWEGSTDHLAPLSDSSLATWWMQARAAVPASRRRGFDSFLLLVAWRLWKERNVCVFSVVAHNVSQAAEGLIEEAETV
jgi:hypothetical protein